MCKRLYPLSIEFFNKEILPLIKSCYSKSGRPQRIGDYHVFNAILYVLRTGIPWRDLPKCYWYTIYLRFKKGSDRGVWWHILIKLQQVKKLRMNIVLADSTTINGGGLKGGSKAEEEALVPMTTKLHLAITPEGYVVEGLLTGGNVADISVADYMIENVSGCYVVEDKGYDSNDNRINLRSNNNIPVIPGRKNRKEPIIYDRSIYKIRRIIEMLFGKIKENRRLSMRFDKSDSSFLAFIDLAIITINI